jgi:hypothetical protein
VFQAREFIKLSLIKAHQESHAESETISREIEGGKKMSRGMRIFNSPLQQHQIETSKRVQNDLKWFSTDTLVKKYFDECSLTIPVL